MANQSFAGNFFQGLLGGLATGVVDQTQAQRKQDYLKELQMAQVAGDLIKSGNYEALSYFDPKALKALGFAGPEDEKLQSLVGFQRAQKQAGLEQERQKTATSRAQEQYFGAETQAKLAGIPAQAADAQLKASQAGLAEADAAKAKQATAQAAEKERFIQGLPADQQLIARVPEIGQLQVSRDRLAELTLQHKQLADQHTERMRLLQEQISNTALDQAERAQSRKDMESQRKIGGLQNQIGQAQARLQTAHERIYDNKTKLPTMYTNQKVAESEANILNQTIARHNALVREHNSLNPGESLPELPEYGAMLASPQIVPLLGKEGWIVTPKAGEVGAGQPTAPTEGSAQAIFEKRHGMQQPTAGASPATALPSVTPAQASPTPAVGTQPEATLVVPGNEKKRQTMLAAVERAKRYAGMNSAWGGPQDAVEVLVDAGIPRGVAQRAVENKTIDGLKDVLEAGVSLAGKKR